jgi:hypothetical protein
MLTVGNKTEHYIVQPSRLTWLSNTKGLATGAVLQGRIKCGCT